MPLKIEETLSVDALTHTKHVPTSFDAKKDGSYLQRIRFLYRKRNRYKIVHTFLSFLFLKPSLACFPRSCSTLRGKQKLTTLKKLPARPRRRQQSRQFTILLWLRSDI